MISTYVTDTFSYQSNRTLWAFSFTISDSIDGKDLSALTYKMSDDMTDDLMTLTSDRVL